MMKMKLPSLTVILLLLVGGNHVAFARKMNKRKKSSSSTLLPEIPSCPIEDDTSKSAKGRGGGRGNNGGKSSSSNGKGSSQEEENTCNDPTTVVCGGTYTGQVTLEASLQCPGDDITAITMVGPNAVLDCAGNMIFNGATTEPSSGSFGILLVNGATAMNCLVEGFGDGVYMNGGNNVLKDSKVFGNADGIEMIGTGCMTIENVEAFANTDDGIDVDDPSGTLIISNFKALANGGNGIEEGTTGNLLMVLIDSMLSSNEQDGMQNGASTGSVEVELYGTNTFSGNGESGIENRLDLTTNFGTLNVFNNGDAGVSVSGTSTFVFAEGSINSVCNNAPADLESNCVDCIFVDLTGGTVVCGTQDGPAVNCVPTCPADETAASCSD